MSMIHLETILHVMMNNMIDNDSPLTSAMVYHYCKDNLLPHLVDTTSGLDVLRSFALKPGINAIAETMFRSAVEEWSLEVVTKILSLPGLDLDVDIYMGQCFGYDDGHHSGQYADNAPQRWCTPLEISAKLGHVTIVNALVNTFHADVNKILWMEKDTVQNCETSPSSPALIAGIWSSAPAFDKCTIVNTLLDAGALICVRDLIRVGLQNKHEVFRAILEHGSISRPCCWDWMIGGLFHTAAFQFCFDNFQSLVQKFSLTVAEVGQTIKYQEHDILPCFWDVVFMLPRFPPNVIDIFAEKGDLQAVRTLRDRGIPFTDNTMVAALRSRNPCLVEFALNEDAPVCAFSLHYRITPLAESLRLRLSAWTSRILQRIDIHILYSDERTYCSCLAAAAESGNRALTKHLLKYTQWQRGDVLGYTLLKAVEMNRTEIAISLLEAGAWTDLSRCTGILGFAPAPKILEPCSGSNLPRSFEFPVLMRNVLRHRNSVLFQALLNHDGANENVLMRWVKGNCYTEEIRPINGGHGGEFVALAAEWGDITVLKCLIDAGFSPMSSISSAMQKGDCDLAEALIKRYSRNYRFDASATLLEAARMHNVSIVRILLEDPSMVFERSSFAPALATMLRGSRETMTPLLEYIRRHEDILSCWKALHMYGNTHYNQGLCHTRDEQLRDFVVETALEIICNNQQLAVSGLRHFLESRSDSLYSPKASALHKWELNIVRTVLKLGADPQCIMGPMGIHGSEEGRRMFTPILVAIQMNDLSLVLILIDAGANVNSATSGRLKRTPLQMAAEVGSKAMIERLLLNGANVHSPCAIRGGATPLQLAAIGGHIGLMEMFLNLGANPREPGAKVDGRTALEGAAEHGRISAVKYLTDLCQYEADECQRAMKLAKGNGHNAVVDLLKVLLDGMTPCAEQEQSEMTVEELLANITLDAEFDTVEDAPEMGDQDFLDFEVFSPCMNHRIEGFEDLDLNTEEVFREPGDAANRDGIGIEDTEPPGIILNEAEGALTQALVPLQDSHDAPSTAGPDVLEKKFACHICYQRFPRNDTLRRHVDKHNRKRFGCQRSSKHFARRDVLNRHLRRDHGITTSGI